MEFIQCEKIQDAQIPTLQATYRIKGKYSSEVEKYLIDMFGNATSSEDLLYLGNYSQ
ncbi:hypothetical protein LEP1GSC075_0226 [Leptospira interrogans str. Kito]|nr:hypothetical protein LEP1GSC069_3661 [Leptospira interrogans serovar Canicola str. Fiocruz LV133]EMK19714.1 hypothetical protein LEP1GSC075_0226 [Leptospira interrogans str. Kito]EMN75794.1 hypothetical protein LEP1GSC102_1137 [Leptospira interrogans str. UI 09600]